jgi:hypothetical protein
LKEVTFSKELTFTFISMHVLFRGFLSAAALINLRSHYRISLHQSNSMAQANVVGTYLRYKAGTSKLVTWLAESVLRSSSPPPPKQKLSTEDLVDYAGRIVATKKPRIAIDLNILYVLSDIIAGRKECAQFYASDSISRSDASHQHFVAALQKILDLLQTEYRNRLNKTMKKELDDNGGITIPNLTNIFALLNIEEPSAATEDAATNTASKAKGVGETPEVTKETTYELEKTEEDVYFALWCLLKDLSDIRRHLRSACDQSKSHPLMMTTVNFLAKVASVLSDARIDEFRAEYPEVYSAYSIRTLLGLQESTKRTVVEMMYQRQLDDAGVRRGSASAPISDTADLLCLPAWTALYNYHTALELHTDAFKDFSAETRNKFLEYCHPFAKMLLNLEPMLAKMALPGNAGDAHRELYENKLDALTQNLMHYRQKRLMPLEILVYVQIHLDLWSVIPADLERGINALAGIWDVTRSSIRSLKAFHGSASEQVRKHLPDLVERADNLLDLMTPVVPPGKTTAWAPEDATAWAFKHWSRSEVLTVPMPILKALPMLPLERALLVLRGRTTFGVDMCCAQPVVLTTAHLYRAARVTGLLEREWPDMEFIIENQNSWSSSKFCRTTAKDSYEVAKHFRLSLGMKLGTVNFGRRHVLPNSETISNQATKMSLCSPMSEAINTAAALEKSLGVGNPLAVIYDCIKLHASKSNGIRNHSLASQYEHTRAFTPTQLLAMVQEIVVQEELQVNFNYFGFIERCLELLNQVSQNCTTEFLINFLPSVDDCMFHQLVDEILYEAAAAELRKSPLQSTMLQTAAKILKAEIDLSGEELLQKAHEVSSKFDPDAVDALLSEAAKLSSASQHPAAGTGEAQRRLSFLGDIDEMIEQLTPENKATLDCFSSTLSWSVEVGEKDRRELLDQILSRMHA